MLIKAVFITLLALEFTADVWSHIEAEIDDYVFPLEPVIKFCTLAEQCKHDYVAVCGQDTLGITKWFVDFCDMYELNCDDKKRIFVVGLATKVWSHVEIEAEDYFFPIEPAKDYCKSADTCMHDFVPICGQDTFGLSRKFTDNCDLFEFNCDEKKRFRHVEMVVCEFLEEGTAPES